MGQNEHRQIARDSLFVMADLRVAGSDSEARVRVRNLSAGGLMADGGPKLALGQSVSLNLRNLGWVDGSVAWVQGARCGIAFHDEIDPLAVREPSITVDHPNILVRRPASSLRVGEDRQRIRKI